MNRVFAFRARIQPERGPESLGSRGIIIGQLQRRFAQGPGSGMDAFQLFGVFSVRVASHH